MTLQLELKQAEASKASLEDILPTYGSDHAAAFDLRADLKGRSFMTYDQEKYCLQPKQTLLVPTGFVFGIPEGYQMNIYSRSGLTLKNGVVVKNAPAVVDQDYSDETFVILYNSSDDMFVIGHGMRIAQAAINPVHRVSLGSLGGRTGGFGSSGV